MRQNYQAEKLIKRYNDGICTEQEKAIVESWYLQELSNSKFIPSERNLIQAHARGRKAMVSYTTPPVKQLWSGIAAVAVVLIFLSIGTYYISNKYSTSISSERSTTVITPGGNKALLKLADGRQIQLNNAKSGTLVLQGNTEVKMMMDGGIKYQSFPDRNNLHDCNVLSTPSGGKYQLVLKDGTKVWLNAASSISFPTSFQPHERKVEITGEVYFEVAHDPSKPFRVTAHHQIVEVLGTHFNINAYADDGHLTTTLLEGAVKVSVGKNSITIKPGEQSIMINNHLSKSLADTEDAVAWKNGYFKFKDEKIQSVMRKIARWYNIEVHYEGKISNEGFNGAISRSKNLSQVLHILEKTKAVQFKIDGRRVIVIP